MYNVLGLITRLNRLGYVTSASNAFFLKNEEGHFYYRITVKGKYRKIQEREMKFLEKNLDSNFIVYVERKILGLTLWTETIKGDKF